MHTTRALDSILSGLILSLIVTCFALSYIIDSYFTDITTSRSNNEVYAKLEQMKIEYEHDDIVFEYDDVSLPYNISKDQYNILLKAETIAKEVGVRYPSKFQALLWQETHAGGLNSWRVAGYESLPPLKRYYGVGQVKVAAAKDMIKKHPSLNRFSHTGKFKTDDEILAHLALDDEFNIWVAAYYFKWMGRNNVDTNYQITAYNRGYEGARHIENTAEFHYTKMVNIHEKTIIKTIHEYTRKIRTADNTDSAHRENI